MIDETLGNLAAFVLAAVFDIEVSKAELLRALRAEVDAGMTGSSLFEGRMDVGKRLIAKLPPISVKRGIVEESLRLARYYGHAISLEKGFK